MKTRELLRSLIVGAVLSVAGCGDTDTIRHDLSETDACAQFGRMYCAKLAECGELGDVSQADCVQQMNAHCGDSRPAPGWCKGSAQVNSAAATACAEAIHMDTCEEFSSVHPGPCNTVCAVR